MVRVLAPDVLFEGAFEMGAYVRRAHVRYSAIAGNKQLASDTYVSGESIVYLNCYIAVVMALTEYGK